MRLLDVSSLTLSEFGSGETPRYAILSHRWGSDEVTYSDLIERRNVKSEGYSKVARAAACVRTELQDIRWLWVDTCCIDKRSSAELTEAINSMFRWYQEAAVCLAYLADVTVADDLDSFKRSSWFTRGWTLQELLAPSVVMFFSSEWKSIGYKGTAPTSLRYGRWTSTVALEPLIEIATGIPKKVLHDYRHGSDVSTAEKWRWIEKRETTRAEDMAYCLLGLFNVHISLCYGEGIEKAMARLSAEMIRQGDTDALTWNRLWTNSTLPRNRNFVDRPYFMKQITGKLRAPAGRVALTGIGGIGKTQLAVEYCHRLRATSPNTIVLWIHSHSGSGAHLLDGLHKVTQQLMLGGVGRCRQEKIEPTEHGDSCDDSIGQWLIIIDGLDEAGLLSDSLEILEKRPDDHGRFRTLFDTPSRRKNGSILITSRSRHIALQLVDGSEILEVGPLEVDEGALLVERTLGRRSGDADVIAFKQLSMAFENIPIAVTQATMKILTTRDSTSTSESIKGFLENKSSRLSVLEGDDVDFGRHRQAKDSILATWQTSFEHMARIRPSVIGTLSVMSQCYHKRCSRSFFTCLNLQSQRAGGKKGTIATSPGEDQAKETENDILVLIQYSLLTQSAEHEDLEMLELVQLSIRIWLIGRGQFDQLQGQYVANLRNLMSRIHTKGHLEYQDLQPHVKTVQDDIPASPDALLQWASLMHTSAWFAMSVGNAEDAQTMAELSVQERARELGSDHVKTLSSMGLVALAKQEAGLLKDAAEIGKEVVAKANVLLGKEHLLTLTNTANLSRTFQAQGRWNEAEAMEHQVFDGTRKVFGPDHPSTIASMHNMASIMRHTGRLDKAQALMHDVLAWEEKQLGNDHSATLTTTDNLALLLQSAGRLQEAEIMGRRAFQGFEKVLGLDHPDTWTSSHNLASILRDGGKLQESCTLLRRTTAKREQILGKNHPHTLSSLSSLASVHKDMEQYDEAEGLNRTVLEARQRSLGPEHPQTLTSMSNLGLVLRCRGKYKEAERLTRRALEGYRQTLGNDHAHTLTSINNLADLLQEQGYRSYHKTAEERRPRGYTKTQRTERATGKHKRSSAGSLNLAIRGHETVKRSKTRVAQV